jgi:hypothetical protein
MPAIDIPTSTNSGDAGSKGGAFGTGIPLPILLALVGGGIGLIVFLMKQQGGGSSGSQNVGTGPNQNTLLPNTAIMLGSLQDSLLNLQGQVSTGNADLSSQLTGVGENLGSQIDSQSAQIQQSFDALNTYLQNSMGTVTGNEDALGQAIATLGTQNSSMADTLTAEMNTLLGLQNQLTQTGTALQGQIGGLSSGASSGFSTTLAEINGIMAQQNAIQTQLTALGVNLKAPAATPAAYVLAPLNRQAAEVQNNYLKTSGSGYLSVSGAAYDAANAAFLSDYSTNPYHGGYITSTGAWAPLVMAGPGS